MLVLTLGRNHKIGDAGAKAIASALPESALETLSLDDCGIGEDGAQALLQALQSNQTHLTYLNLGSNNHITQPTLEAIKYELT